MLQPRERVLLLDYHLVAPSAGDWTVACTVSNTESVHPEAGRCRIMSQADHSGQPYLCMQAMSHYNVTLQCHGTVHGSDKINKTLLIQFNKINDTLLNKINETLLAKHSVH